MDVSNIPASRMSRLAAVLIDSFVFYGVVGTLVAIGGDDGTQKAKVCENIGIAAMACIMVGQVVLLSVHGQSVGKMIMRIKIVKLSDLSNGGFVTNVILRGLINIAGITVVVPIIDVLYIFSESKQCLHDKIAGTIVVKSALLNGQGNTAQLEQAGKKSSDKAFFVAGFVMIGGPILLDVLNFIAHIIVVAQTSNFHEPIKMVPLPVIFNFLLIGSIIACGIVSGFIYKKYSMRFSYGNLGKLVAAFVIIRLLCTLRSNHFPAALIIYSAYIASPFLGSLLNRGRNSAG